MTTQLKAFLDKPIPYEGVELEIAKTFRRVLYVLPIPILAIALLLYFDGFQLKGLIVTAMVPITILTVYFVNIGHMRLGIIIITTVTNLTVTWICMVGYGIHDPGIIMFPTTILTACLVLKNRELWFVSSFAVACISVITLSEYYGFYTPKTVYSDNLTDVISVIILLSIGLMASSTISSKVKKTIKDEKKEIEHQEALASEIQHNIEKKNSLFREVHHRVKNHLAFVNSLIDLEALDDVDEKEKSKELQARVIAVARVHDQLYKSDKYETVNSKEYLEGLISNFLISHNLSHSQLNFHLDDTELDVDKIIPLGISLHEIISSVAKHGHANPILNMHFILTKGKVNIMTIICNQELSTSTDDDSIEIQVLNLMVKKMGGTLDLIKGKNKSLFELTF